jgi:putative zinc finger/helix-turn-helix YgiT family protein
MNRQTVFCPECRQDVIYVVKEKRESAELKGDLYEFMAQIAYCEQCGQEVFVPELEDVNLKELYDTYRQKNDIISLEKIQSLPEKYNIGKRPLSLLLGWGEQTFSRYYDGDMPTKQYSEILKLIHADPAYYLSLLEKGKENLKSEKAYEKSKVITERLLDYSATESQSKIEVVADYLLSKCGDITPLSLQKALYYAQGFCYASSDSQRRTRMNGLSCDFQLTKMTRIKPMRRLPRTARGNIPAAMTIPTAMLQNRKAMSRGSLIADRKRTIDSAPTIPSERTTLLVTAKMTSVDIMVSPMSVTPKLDEYITPRYVSL